ncbi:hypothetical protein ABZ663_30775 [Streptomyces albidoflavus]|uniref:hypothetical protein n=1 Tax=Streptomyces albidoflavus TaxID=1886 RepID=UPI0033D39EAC
MPTCPVPLPAGATPCGLGRPAPRGSQPPVPEAGARAARTPGPLLRLWRDANTATTHPTLNQRPSAHAFAEGQLVP